MDFIKNQVEYIGINALVLGTVQSQLLFPIIYAEGLQALSNKEETFLNTGSAYVLGYIEIHTKLKEALYDRVMNDGSQHSLNQLHTKCEERH